MHLLFNLLELEEKVNNITNYFTNSVNIANNCNCQHCVEIKNQLNRAEKRQCEILSETSLE